MAADRQWAHSSVPKTNMCAGCPAQVDGGAGGVGGRGSSGCERKSHIESCRRSQNKATMAKITQKESRTSGEVWVSGVFTSPLTPGAEEAAADGEPFTEHEFALFRSYAHL